MYCPTKENTVKPGRQYYFVLYISQFQKTASAFLCERFSWFLAGDHTELHFFFVAELLTWTYLIKYLNAERLHL